MFPGARAQLPVFEKLLQPWKTRTLSFVFLGGEGHKEEAAQERGLLVLGPSCTDSSCRGILLRRYTGRDDTRASAHHGLIANGTLQTYAAAAISSRPTRGPPASKKIRF